MTISCVFMGGLGNQLFQFFTTFAYSMRTFRRCVFPYSEELHIGKTRPTYWHSLLKDMLHMTTFEKSNTGNIRQYSNNDLENFPVYRENGFKYTEIPKFQQDDVRFYGYFQSYKYFKKDFVKICALLKLHDQKIQLMTEYPEYDFTYIHSISMHFRLGDYKENQPHHPIMPYQYYENALNCILENRDVEFDQITVYYFCEKEDNDEVNKTIMQLQTKFLGLEFVKVQDDLEDWKQMLLMSLCNDNIIANSSFSWWGAYFNVNPDKIVCYPSLWFGDKIMNENVDDLFPDSWEKIVF